MDASFAPLETDRLVLRELTAADAPFILALLNDPDWLLHIGDRNVRTLADAESFITDRLMAHYRERGFGFWLAVSKLDGASTGLCGLVKRDGLDDIDVGYAFLPPYRGRGLAFEAAEAAVAYARDRLCLKRLVAITSENNIASARLLERLGLRFEGLKQIKPYGPSRLFAIEF
jgi:RimJ/RimL family protein N-acetyltransferase